MNSLESINLLTRKSYNLAVQKYHDLFCNEIHEKEYDWELLDRYANKFTRNSLIGDAGCGPSSSLSTYLTDKGLNVIGVDLSDRCTDIARSLHPGLHFQCGDITNLNFANEYFNGIVSFYSIIHTPKRLIGSIFNEFYRVLKPDGYLLVAVKAGSCEGFAHQLLGIPTEIYFSFFSEQEIEEYFTKAGYRIEFIEKRNPYEFEIQNERIFAIGKKVI